jgi:hypothetical protein
VTTTIMRSLSLVADPVPPAHKPDGGAIPSAPAIAESGQAEIANVAYALFLERGGTDGHDVEDWLRAEQILRERRSIACDLGLADLDL